MLYYFGKTQAQRVEKIDQ